jgi:hypothetical protein
VSVAITIVDAHAHVHACFEPEASMDAAWEHFADVAGERDFSGVLMLAEPAASDALSALRAESWSRWTLEPGHEPIARRARCASSGRMLWLVSGFQVPTAEGLEVLCLGCEKRPDDRRAIDEVANQARESGALAVVPWGAGKWLGRRGTALSRFLAETDDPGVFLGDNGGRPHGWYPRHFDEGAPRGFRVLPGSDPLPFASQSGRLGAHGFCLSWALSDAAPIASLIAQLEDPATRPEPFGRREAPLRFVRNQLAMQWQMRAHTGGH